MHLQDCSAQVLVTQTALLPIARKAAKAVGLAEDRIILIGDNEDKAGQFRMFTQILDKSGKEQRTRLSPKDLSFLVYSSGTTGKPKGVMLNHSNTVSNIEMLAAVEGKNMRSGKDKILAVLPYYHIYGQSVHVTFNTSANLLRSNMPHPPTSSSRPRVNSHAII